MWEMDDRTANVRLAGLSAQVDLSRPHEGIHNVEIRAQTALDAAVLQTQLGDQSPERGYELVDSYVRGVDLVASYVSIPQRSINPQIYWRAVCHQDVEAVGVEILVSIQTSLLDSEPSMAVGSVLPRSDVWRLLDAQESCFEHLTMAGVNPCVIGRRPGMFLFRLAGMDCSYVEMIHPADFSVAEVRTDAPGEGRIRSTFQLFNEPLEKGVIRRGRVCGMFLARDGDERTAAECYRRFVQSAVPLTV